MDENDAAAFTICTEHHGKVRNRDLGYTNAGQLLPVPGWQWHILGGFRRRYTVLGAQTKSPD